MVKYSRSARAVAGHGSRLEYKVLLSLVALFVRLACVLRMHHRVHHRMPENPFMSDHIYQALLSSFFSFSRSAAI